MIGTIVYGVAVGASRSLYGYDKAKGEAFDWTKFAKTAIIGGVVGGLAAYSGVTFEVMTTSLENFGIMTMVTYGGTIAADFVVKKIYAALKYLKG
jgi:hypothetical protein